MSRIQKTNPGTVRPKVRVLFWSEDNEDLPDDCWLIAEKAEEAFLAAGLRAQRGKELGPVAFDENDEPIGAIFFSLTQIPASDRGGPEDECVLEYSFDIGVHPDHQGGVVGWMLCAAAIREAKDLEADYIYNRVVNPRMADMLEKLFGFEHEGSPSTLGGYSSYMIKWL